MHGYVLFAWLLYSVGRWITLQEALWKGISGACTVLEVKQAL